MFPIHYTSLENRGALLHTRVVKCFQKCGFNWNTLGTTKDYWGQLKADVSFEEHVSCDYDAVTCEVQTLEQMMDKQSTSDVSQEEEDGKADGGKRDPPATFLPALEDI